MLSVADYMDSPENRLADFLWSPDGGRVSVSVPDHVLELSAEDGSVLARHPSIKSSYLVWPATRP